MLLLLLRPSDRFYCGVFKASGRITLGCLFDTISAVRDSLKECRDVVCGDDAIGRPAMAFDAFNFKPLGILRMPSDAEVRTLGPCLLQ